MRIIAEKQPSREPGFGVAAEFSYSYIKATFSNFDLSDRTNTQTQRKQDKPQAAARQTGPASYKFSGQFRDNQDGLDKRDF